MRAGPTAGDLWLDGGVKPLMALELALREGRASSCSRRYLKSRDRARRKAGNKRPKAPRTSASTSGEANAAEPEEAAMEAAAAFAAAVADAEGETADAAANAAAEEAEEEEGDEAEEASSVPGGAMSAAS